MIVPTCESCVETSGGRPAQWKALQPIRSTSMYRFLPAKERPCRWRRLATPSLTYSPGLEDSVTHLVRLRYRPRPSSGLIPRLQWKRITVHSYYLIEVTKLRRKLE